MTTDMESLVDQAREGDKNALEELIREIQGPIFGLAIRMLYLPADAEDATQEILVKVITHLSDFRGESSIWTWIYRLAANHLLTTHKRRAERKEVNFEYCAEQIDQGLALAGSVTYPEAEQALITEEIMISCLQGILLCLDREQLMAYALGEILEVTSDEGAEILNITSATYRKRLSRARSRLRDFLKRKCGLFEPSNPCRCEKMTAFAVKTRWIDPDRPLFSGPGRRMKTKAVTMDWLQGELDELGRMAALLRDQSRLTVSPSFIENIKRFIESRKFKIHDA